MAGDLPADAAHRSIHRVVLAGPADRGGFREAARRLLSRAVPPERIAWEAGGAQSDLLAFGEAPQDAGAPASVRPSRAPPRVTRAFLDQAEAALLHSDPGRFVLVYRILWRLPDEPGLLALASDPDLSRLAGLARAVRRDIHKMHAFVRFREVGAGNGERFVAWYEPDHHVAEAAGPFFARRFASLHWSILTPRVSLHWTGEAIVHGPGAQPREAPVGDGLETLWLTYYANIFNPARVNPRAMRAEMPRRFWPNLPEAGLIRSLIDEAPARAARMVAAAPTEPVLRRGGGHRGQQPSAARDPGVGLPAAEAVRGCRFCPLWEPATQGVPGVGPAPAHLMLVGEQPGDEEDIAGRPFVGPAGRLLDTALAAAGLERGGLYLTNAVKHFKFAPRGKRRLHKRPSGRDIEACIPWLGREIAAVDPRVVVLLGASAASAVLGENVAVTRLRGRPFDLPDGRKAVITTHPAYVLRLEDRAESARAFDRLVDDLRLGASLARQDAADPSTA